MIVSFAAAVLLLPVLQKGLAVGGIYALIVALVPQEFFDGARKKKVPKCEQDSDQKLKMTAGVDWTGAGNVQLARMILRYMAGGALVVVV